MDCRRYDDRANSVEWVEKGEPRGMRILARDRRWIDPAFRIEGQHYALCDTCPRGQIAVASNFRFAIGDFSQTRREDLEAAVSPDAVAQIFAAPPYGITGVTYRAKGDAVPVSLGELTGLARRIGIEEPGGWSGEVIALWVSKGCVSVSALLTATSATEIAADGLDMFVRAFGAEWYKPMPNSFNTPLKFFGLGDGFRPEYWGLK